jgi:hypothetical protein
MDEARLAEIEARLKATTPGPWRHGSMSAALWLAPETDVLADEDWVVPADDPPAGLEEYAGQRLRHTFCITQPISHVRATDPEGGEGQEGVDWLCHSEPDARFLAHAAVDVADLLAEVRRLRALREAESIPGGNDAEKPGHNPWPERAVSE